MSSPEALATVTTALRNLLSDDMGGAAVTTKPPSVARNGESGAQLNIFLYSVRHSPSLRNEPPLGKAKNGELAYPPMPLILKYLITAYGADNDDISGQILLGKAMRILHDHPLLGQADLKDIVPESGLHEQAERIRITPDTLNLDDMSKLWSSFQSAEYRLSVGYEISVVLIESNRVGKAPLPVLRRGEGNRGPELLPDSVIPDLMPSLVEFHLPNVKMAAELGDIVILSGKKIPIPSTPDEKKELRIFFQHSLLGDQFEIDTNKITFLEQEDNLNKIKIDISPPFTGYPGFYTISLQKQKEGEPAEWTTNQIAMPLAPKISVLPRKASSGDIKVTINCIPKIRKEQQKVSLLFGNKIILIPENFIEDSTDGSRIEIPIPRVSAKKEPYIVRLRVDGVDSIPWKLVDGTPEFDQNQTVTIS